MANNLGDNSRNINRDINTGVRNMKPIKKKKGEIIGNKFENPELLSAKTCSRTRPSSGTRLINKGKV